MSLPSLQISCVKDLTSNSLNVLTSVVTPQGVERTPLDICCVVDISGSMDTEASLQTGSGQRESHGLTILDIVKHATKTIISSLSAKDRMSLVTYSTTARTEHSLISMNENGKKEAIKKLTSLHTEGCTNLWDGLLHGMEVLRKRNDSTRLATIFLLTDGQPNEIPPAGHIPSLRAYKDKNKNLSCTINTFGFGYNLDTELLVDLASEGDGLYTFIPDSGFVGTAFVNQLAAQLSTFGTLPTLSLEPQGGTSFTSDSIFGGMPRNMTSWGSQISLASLHYGQNRCTLIKLALPETPVEGEPLLTATLKFKPPGSDTFVEVTADLDAIPSDVDTDQSNKVQVELARCKTISCIGKVLHLAKSNRKQAAIKEIEDTLTEIAKSPLASDPFVADLVKDLDGQVSEATSKDQYWKKWGRHYLPSLHRAHCLQMCSNFKDPGLQHYGGKLFKECQDEADEIFCKLPPPTPSAASSGRGYGSSSASRSARAPTSMNAYHCRGNPCFSGCSMVKMANGTLKRVDQIRKGDIVATGAGSGVATVVCVVMTRTEKGEQEMVRLPGGMLVTPYHPISPPSSSEWLFPCQLAPTYTFTLPAVFSFVLSGGHSLLINGLRGASLGHGISSSPILSHPYFGTDRVLQDLRRMVGWDAGLVQFGPLPCLRSRTSGLITSLLPSSNLHQQPEIAY